MKYGDLMIPTCDLCLDRFINAKWQTVVQLNKVIFE